MLQGRDDGDLAKVMLVMEEEELQDLATAWMWVVRGKVREDAGSPGKAPGSPAGSGTFTGLKSSFSGSTQPHPTCKGGEHSSGPTMEALAVGWDQAPSGESDHLGQQDVRRSRWRKGYHARGMRTLLAAWPQPFHRQQEAGLSLPQGLGALWSQPRWLQSLMSEFLGPGNSLPHRAKGLCRPAR